MPSQAMPTANGSSVKQTVGSSVLPPPPLPTSLARIHSALSASITINSSELPTQDDHADQDGQTSRDGRQHAPRDDGNHEGNAERQ